MFIIDIILIIILFGFALWGWQTGLIRAVGGFIGIILGIILANKYYLVVADWLLPHIQDRENLSKVLGYLAIFVGVNIIILLALSVLTGIFKFIPLLTTVNRLAGAILALIGGILAIGFLLVIIKEFPFTEFLIKYTKESVIVPWLTFVYDLIAPIVPSAFGEAREIIKNNK